MSAILFCCWDHYLFIESDDVFISSVFSLRFYLRSSNVIPIKWTNPVCRKEALMQKSHHERSHSDTPPLATAISGAAVAAGGAAIASVSLSAESSSVASLPGLRRGSVSSQGSQASQVCNTILNGLPKLKNKKGWGVKKGVSRVTYVGLSLTCSHEFIGSTICRVVAVADFLT